MSLIEPFAPFDRQVSLVSIVPKEAYERLGATQFNQTPIGSGPYKVVRWVKDDRIELEAFADYWDGPAKIKNAVFRPIPAESQSRCDPVVRRDRHRPDVAAGACRTARTATRGPKRRRWTATRSSTWATTSATGFLAIPISGRQSMRRIDREAIANRLLRGFGKPIGQLVSPVSFGYDPAIPAPNTIPNLPRSCSTSAGYNGEKIIIQYPSNNFNSTDEVVQAVGGYMKAVGINVELQNMEYTAFFPMWTGRKLNSMHAFSYGPTTLDSDLPLTSLFETGRSRGYWSDAKADELIRAQRAEPQADKRKALIAQVWKMSQENVVYSPLYSETHLWGIRDRVRITPRPDGLVRLRDIEPATN